jgi:hypothetical protein
MRSIFKHPGDFLTPSKINFLIGGESREKKYVFQPGKIFKIKLWTIFDVGTNIY